MAKAALRSAPKCASTALEVFEKVDMTGTVKRALFDQYIQDGSVCWLQWSLSSVPLTNVSSTCCEAADTVLTQHLRLHEPAIAPDIYEQEYYHHLDDEAVALALSSFGSVR